MKINKSGFSLIELSVVILIVGILVIGITKGSRIIAESRLKSAQSLSNNSPMLSMTGLVLWLDFTEAKNIATGSFGAGGYGTSSIDNGASVTNLKDRIPYRETDKIFTAPGGTNLPTYVRSGIGGLPSLRFDGDDYLVYTNPSGVVASGKSGQTIFAVFRGVNQNDNFIFSQGVACSGNNMDMTFTSLFTLIACGSGDSTSGFPVTPGINYIGVIRINRSFATGKVKFYLNNLSTSTDPVGLSSLIAGNVTIGSSSSFPGAYPFTGLLSEIIVFDRALTENEITDIRNYLSRKYSIKIQ